jgi:hypothetical protein
MTKWFIIIIIIIIIYLFDQVDLGFKHNFFSY